MAREDTHFRLRISEALKARITESAAENNRSMTAEIISRLERSFEIALKWEEALLDIEELKGQVADLERAIEEHDLILFPPPHEKD